MSRNGASELALWVMRMNEREREREREGGCAERIAIDLMMNPPPPQPGAVSESDRSNAVVFQSFGRSHTHNSFGFASRSMVCSLAICIAKKNLSASRFSCTQNSHNYFCQELIATLTTSTYY
jgi:hypothetical protein